MSVVRSEFIAENSPLINALSKSEVLFDTLSLIAGTRIVASVSKDEEYLITKQERKGDIPGHLLFCRDDDRTAGRLDHALTRRVL